MPDLTPLESVDYLIIGHLTRDLTPQGPRMGGTAAYAALTAHALGLRVGIVTAWGAEVPTAPLDHIPVFSHPAEHSTTFENIYQDGTRRQVVHFVAPKLDYHHIPETWRQTAIVHLGPVAQEVEPGLVRHFPAALVGVTPQGWLRTWDENGQVHPTEWPEASFVLEQAGAAVISTEDVDGDEIRIEEMAVACRVLAVTEAHLGAKVYWHNDVRRFRAPHLREIDATGAGDVFAAAFFTRLYTTRDPWEAGRFATQVASISITRAGLDSIPTADEIQSCLVEVL
ncbi:MAG: hypothetical protein JW726_06675 [Anaerolineales bacterium]|nr:hypothetical protein [Anaerolineales bacterium]